MFLGHIGEKDIEMIYDVLPGDNFGWSEREGSFVHNKADACNLYPLPDNDSQFGYVYPLAEYDHNRPPELACGADAGHAVSGGFMYRGPVRALRGKYIFGDLVDGRVFYLDECEMQRARGERATIHELTVLDTAGKESSVPQLVGDSRVDLHFGTDADHNLYLLAKANGKIWKVTGARPTDASSAVFPSLAPNLQVHYDFEHPASDDPAREVDQGRSGTDLALLNGGAAMRVSSGAYAASQAALKLVQVGQEQAGNDDWKAGVFDANGVASLAAFRGVKGITIMTWVKRLGDGPALNTNTPDPNDRYTAVGIAGLLSGNSDGHNVRALIELIEVDGKLKLVALGRRLDEGRSQTFAANDDWQLLLPREQWVHLAASFDFGSGTMKLYRNGQPIAGTYTATDDPWELSAGGDLTSSPTLPRGIKLGGSFPQNDQEKNPGNCELDAVMFLDRAVTQLEVDQQYRRIISAQP
jgi:hypothetical protein